MKRELWYSVVVRDRHGKIVSRERRKSRSFLKQWNQLFYRQMAGQSLTITDTAGAGQTVGASTGNFAMNAAITVITYGIRVGTGFTAVAIDDYALETPIDEGTGAGQMDHLVCTVADFVVAAPSCSFLVSRSVLNNSGALITVKESAIYMRMGASYYGCAVRDVFAAPQDVPNGGSITINYTLRVTV